MRALVISGGGSKGAFAGGIAEYLISECENKYDLFLGTSTGSLLVPLLSIGEISKLKEVYTSVSQRSIFSRNPFIIKKKNDGFEIKMNHFNILLGFLKGSRTFGESKSLRQLILNTLTPEFFEQMKWQSEDVVVTVSNISLGQVEYKSLKDFSREEFCDWIWASANMIPFMSLVKKDGFDYGDGGLGNIVPISEAINRGASEVDVIVLKTEKQYQKKPVSNALELTTRVFDFLLDQIIRNDLALGKLRSKHEHVNLNFYHPPEMLTKNSLIFDSEQMKTWWNMGYAYAQKTNPYCKRIETKMYK
ncbi:patatin-like phospholipase family protein [Psychroflexus sp. CAK57W]|uniref:patatin-like phospholipase family protein n=1 Tax=Psychroflexus curvus TaxID=2873595 RepID=UPI001CCF03F3|nr:patatin-like phospholipase family protein [Psychroflexus curvus]MBZ9627311.1 patatin-like phospholipase family protein [Psychroflexus curvus]MBZ9787305.1 patatin-like phospholipase family protein [Psychroflexus curvus]